MINVQRYPGNPILKPDPTIAWQSVASFNGCPVNLGATVGLVYRAVGAPHAQSTIGYAEGYDGLSFSHRRQLIVPEHDWERYGCEDPRITKLDDTYYIFYTALSTYPFSPNGIRVAVATSRDLLAIQEKHPVTPFNAKAMALFPKRIHKSLAAVVTVHTDMPPAKICYVEWKEASDMWSEAFWKRWYSSLDSHIIPLQKFSSDQVEVGAPPIATDKGWLLLYCYITGYTTNHPVFGIDAALLDHDDPRVVIGRLREPLLTPEAPYEKMGNVPNVIFPSGALVGGDMLTMYYGAADTTVCAAMVSLPDLLTELLPKRTTKRMNGSAKLSRFAENPLLSPTSDHAWEAKAAFNPAVLYMDGNVHLLYRALSHDDSSALGYAVSRDGVHIDRRLPDPVYTPREWFEQKKQPGYSGCEDPRLTVMDGRIYMLYTAYTGEGAPRVALSSIAHRDFIKNNWNWDKPQLISPPGIDDKNACLLSEKIKGKYVVFHRFGTSIWVDKLPNLKFDASRFLSGSVLMEPRATGWDSEKIGIAGPPIKTSDGWLLIYHGLSKADRQYRLGAALLAPGDPLNVIARLDNPILEPEAEYENMGIRPGTVFACGNVVIGKNLYVYYGGADQVVCGAAIPLASLLAALKSVAK